MVRQSGSAGLRLPSRSEESTSRYYGGGRVTAATRVAAEGAWAGYPEEQARAEEFVLERPWPKLVFFLVLFGGIALALILGLILLARW